MKMVKSVLLKAMYHASSSGRDSLRGFTFIEVMVTLVLLSIMASVAIPYMEIAVQRQKEYELKSVLRKVRSAIDRFHRDWEEGYLSRHSDAFSEDGYPRTLSSLVEGVELEGPTGNKRYYLRRIPNNPFVDPQLPLEEHWEIRGYQDAPDTIIWNGVDVYDIRPLTDKVAIDGTLYSDW